MCAPGENRTHMPFEGHRVLSPARLPVPPPMHGGIVSELRTGSPDLPVLFLYKKPDWEVGVFVT